MNSMKQGKTVSNGPTKLPQCLADAKNINLSNKNWKQMTDTNRIEIHI